MLLNLLYLILSGVGGALSLGGILVVSGYLREKWFALVWRYLNLSRYVDRQTRKFKARFLDDAQIRGKVMDVGSGDGINLKYFIKHKSNIHSILCIEPNSSLHSGLLRRAERLDIPVELFAGTFEEYVRQNPETEFDTITGIFVLCTVINAEEIIGEMYSRLKRDGALLLFEHVKETESRVKQWIQWVFQPIHYYFGGGCNLMRIHAPTLSKYRFQRVREKQFTSNELRFPWLTQFYTFDGVK